MRGVGSAWERGLAAGVGAARQFSQTVHMTSVNDSVRAGEGAGRNRCPWDQQQGEAGATPKTKTPGRGGGVEEGQK